MTLFELDNAISILKGIDEYKLNQIDANNYELHLVSQRPDKEKLSQEASQVLKRLYGREARVLVIYQDAIAPESSGKYLIAKALFPIELDKYLDERFIFKKRLERS